MPLLSFEPFQPSTVSPACSQAHQQGREAVAKPLCGPSRQHRQFTSTSICHGIRRHRQPLHHTPGLREPACALHLLRLWGVGPGRQCPSSSSVQLWTALGEGRVLAVPHHGGLDAERSPLYRPNAGRVWGSAPTRARGPFPWQPSLVGADGVLGAIAMGPLLWSGERCQEPEAPPPSQLCSARVCCILT